MLLLDKISYSAIFLLSIGLCACNEVKVEGTLDGHLDLSAISCIRNSVCLIASDELNSVQFSKIQSGKLIAADKHIKLGAFKNENDIEALTHNGKSFFAIGSHGLSRKKNRYHSSRFKIFRININDEGALLELKISDLNNILKKSKVLSPYFKKSLKKNGINIEGLAFSHGELFIGFRSPVINGLAQFISFDSNKFWSGEQDVELKHYKLNLGDSRGIRSFEFKGDSLYIIAGSSETSSSDESELFVTNLKNLNHVSAYSVPNPQFKLEGFEHLSNGDKLYIYDSQVNGLPTVE
jgi:hypothetical protein